MTSAATGLVARPVIDPARWPDLSPARTGIRRSIESRVARALFVSMIERLPVRVEIGARQVAGGGAGTADAPLMCIHRPDDFFAAVGAGGLIGFGESYMAGDWDAPDLSGLLTVFAAEIATLVPASLQRLRALYVARAPGSERNTAANTRANVARHYDLSNELFAAFLDETLSYSAALFDGTESAGRPVSGESVAVSTPGPVGWDDFATAQHRKIDRLLDAAAVGPGTRLLEIGTGWGELAIRAAARGAMVRSITLSAEQQALARRRIAAAGFTRAVEVDLLDYRAVDGTYDAIVSVEMIEAVGHGFWADYARTLDRVLAPGGRVGLQAITMPDDRMRATRHTYTWINKYIFPGGFLPSTEAIVEMARRHSSLRVVGRLSFGHHYADTLRLWDQRFLERLGHVRGLGFDEVFARMWHFYLEYSRAGFRSGYLDVQQVVLEREAVPTTRPDSASECTSARPGLLR